MNTCVYCGSSKNLTTTILTTFAGEGEFPICQECNMDSAPTPSGSFPKWDTAN